MNLTGSCWKGERVGQSKSPGQSPSCLLLQDFLFLLLIGGGQAHGLLPLVIHHFFHHAASLTVQIRQLERGGERVKETLEFLSPQFHKSSADQDSPWSSQG